MLITNIKRVIEQISRDKGIAFDVLVKAVEEALESATRKKYGNNADIDVQYNEQTCEVEVFLFKEVVEHISFPELQFTVEEGKKFDPDCELGDCLGVKLDTTEFGRIAAQSAKQIIVQKLKGAEKDAIYNSFIEKKNELINGIVQRVERSNIIVNLGQTEGILPSRELGPNELYKTGDRIRAIILKVLQNTRGPQVILSRTHPTFLINLFKTEVPEISEGIVEIVRAAREPGSRSKIAVSSTDSDIDPVGACVGMKGSRVQNVVQELRGEKIDIIPWHVDNARFVCNALAPAEISRVIIDEEKKRMEIVVIDENLSIAIGKKGQNVRLASRLTGWRLNVNSEAKYNRLKQNSLDSLLLLPFVDVTLASLLYEQGFNSAKDVGELTIEELMELSDGISQDDASEIIEYSLNFDEMQKLSEENEIEKELSEQEISEEDEIEKEIPEQEISEEE